MKKILASIILASTLFTVSGISTYADTTSTDATVAATVSADESLNQIVSEITNVISPEVNVSQDGVRIEDKQAILDKLKSVDLNQLEHAARE